MRLIVRKAQPGQVEWPEEFAGEPPTWIVGADSGYTDPNGRSVLDPNEPIMGFQDQATALAGAIQILSEQPQEPTA